MGIINFAVICMIMPLDIGETVNYFCDKLLGSSFIRATMKNPIYTGMLITFCIMLIILINFRQADDVLMLTLRTGFWMFISVLGIIMIHNKILVQETTVNDRKGAFEDVFTIYTPQDDEMVPVNPPVQTYVTPV